jgi:hypothetical protein
VARGLNRARTENFQSKQNWFPRLAWGFATAICILAAFAISHGRGQTEAKASTDVLANIKVVDETLAMFPNQVSAIVQDEHGLNLVLSDSAGVPASPTLYVRISDNKHSSSLVTFSGQQRDVVRFRHSSINVLRCVKGNNNF